MESMFEPKFGRLIGGLIGRLIGVLGLVLVLLPNARAQAVAQTAAPASAPSAASSAAFNAVDLREEVQRIPVTVKDLYGREETKNIAVTIFRPAGEGPHPLAILSHGRATTDRRAQQGRQRFEHQARYLVSLGFAVLVPTRVGYGDTYGDFDPEDSGACNRKNMEPMFKAASDQVLATLEHAKTLPYVDTSRWIALGVSVGGFTTLAVASRNPPGLVGAINFAGGAGGDPERRSANPCLPSNLDRQLAGMGAQTKLPNLWLYWENDRYWGSEIPKRWAKAWEDGGGVLQFHSLPAVGADGHSGMGADMNTWVPLFEAYLARAGFTQSGLIQRPPTSGFARVDETDKVPTTSNVRDGVYKRFLAAKTPRAFALGPGGAAGFATGDWALGRALGFCQARRGVACKLYAVDDEVVWSP